MAGEDEADGAGFLEVLEVVGGCQGLGQGWRQGRPRCSERRGRTGCVPTRPAGTTTSPGAQSATSAGPRGPPSATATARTSRLAETGPATTSSADRKTRPTGPGAYSVMFLGLSPPRETMVSVRTSRTEGAIEPTASLVTTFPTSSCVATSRKGDVTETTVDMSMSRNLPNPSCRMPALIIRMETAADPTADFSTLIRTRTPRKISARISRMVGVPGTSAGSVTLTISIISGNRWPDTPASPG